MMDQIALSQALAGGDLANFIAQEEARGIGPIDRSEFDLATAALIKAPRSADQTLPLPSSGGLTGTKIHQDNGPYGSR